MTEINHACAWGLDPGFIQHNIIIHFMRSLRPIPNEQLPTEQERHICFCPFLSHIPAVRLRCGHIVGTNCLYEWLKSQDCCPHCRIKTFFRPAHWPQQHLTVIKSQGTSNWAFPNGLALLGFRVIKIVKRSVVNHDLYAVLNLRHLKHGWYLEAARHGWYPWRRWDYVAAHSIEDPQAHS